MLDPARLLHDLWEVILSDRLPLYSVEGDLLDMGDQKISDSLRSMVFGNFDQTPIKTIIAGQSSVFEGTPDDNPILIERFFPLYALIAAQFSKIGSPTRAVAGQPLPHFVLGHADDYHPSTGIPFWLSLTGSNSGAFMNSPPPPGICIRGAYVPNRPTAGMIG